MIWNEENFLEQMSHLKFDDELIKYSVYKHINDWRDIKHFFVYPVRDKDKDLTAYDIVFCTEDTLAQIYLIVDWDDVVIDFDESSWVNIKILNEEF